MLNINSEYKKPNFKKLINYGFIKEKNKYTYITDIVQKEFLLRVIVDGENKLKTELIDSSSGELYFLHLIDTAEGSYIARIREEFEKVINNIIKNCFDENVFKSKYTYKIIDYTEKKYGDNPEYLWEKFPNNAIFRRKDNNKWYAAILTVNRNRLTQGTDETVEVINLKSNNTEDIVDNVNYFQAYHMNKKHWISIILDGKVSVQDIQKKIDISYSLAKTERKKTKKRTAEI